MRPTPLDKVPQSEVHVQIGYVADELWESIKMIYEFAARHGNRPVTVRGGYIFSGIRSPLAGELTVEAVFVWAYGRSRGKSNNTKWKEEKCLAMMGYVGKKNTVGRPKERRMCKGYVV